MALTTSGSVGSRTDVYAAPGGGGRKRMPYKNKAQARAVLANTSEANPRHDRARMHAKMALRKPKRKNGLLRTKSLR